MPLTPDQIRAALAVEWLADPSDEQRRTGRSMAVAVALVRIAARNPTRQVNFTDPIEAAGVTHNNAVHIIQAMVSDLIRADPVLRARSTVRHNFFSVNPGLPIEDWWPTNLPTDWTPGPPALRHRALPEPIPFIPEEEPPGESVPDPPTLWDRLDDDG